jgi:hypothetical protein
VTMWNDILSNSAVEHPLFVVESVAINRRDYFSSVPHTIRKRLRKLITEVHLSHYFYKIEKILVQIKDIHLEDNPRNIMCIVTYTGYVVV